MALFDPRVDERPPTFYNGQWFGALPHTRVILTWPGAYGDYAWAADGMVVENRVYSGADPNNKSAIWQGYYDIGGSTYSLLYQWRVTDIGGGEALTRLFLAKQGAGIQWDAYRSYVPLRPADSIPFIVGLPGYDVQIGATGSKVEIPEWSDVVSRWPNARPTYQ